MNYCHICEEKTEAWLALTDNGKIKIVICYGCISGILRWLGRQAMEDSR